MIRGVQPEVLLVLELMEERSTRDLDGCRHESDGLDDNESTWDGYGLK